MNRLTAALAVALLLQACSKAPESATPATAQQTLLISPEDLVTVQSGALSSGPLITGSIQPQRRADLRAEVSAVVLQVLKDNGDRVRRGELLVRLDDSVIRDSLASAEEAVRAVGQSFEQTERQLQRQKTLRESGMASTQQLEDAEIRRNNAQSDLSAARTRAAQARQQLERTLSRAPFDGVVSERKVSAGDTAQTGKELLKVIDPASLRFEGLVSADAIGSVLIDQAVIFRVNGYGPQEFAGTVKRINPSANANTRQVEVLVEFANDKQPQLAGLYAEGRIEAVSKSGLMVPAMAVVREGDQAIAWRVKDSSVQKVVLELGERDPRQGDFVLRSGLNEGDKLIRNPTSALKDGQKVQFQSAAPGVQPAASGTGK
nr:efflux RND transporter periplasmic adaptor subunit [Rhodoferax sp.]